MQNLGQASRQDDFERSRRIPPQTVKVVWSETATHFCSVVNTPAFFIKLIAAFVLGFALAVVDFPTFTDPQSCPPDCSALDGILNKFVLRWSLIIIIMKCNAVWGWCVDATDLSFLMFQAELWMF